MWRNLAPNTFVLKRFGDFYFWIIWVQLSQLSGVKWATQYTLVFVSAMVWDQAYLVKPAIAPLMRQGLDKICLFSQMSPKQNQGGSMPTGIPAHSQLECRLWTTGIFIFVEIVFYPVFSTVLRTKFGKIVRNKESSQIEVLLL